MTDPSELHFAGKTSPTAGLDTVVWVSLSALLLLIFVLPQSFAELKLPFVATILAGLVVGAIGGRWRFEVSVLSYYLCFCVLALAWSMVGLIRGNPIQAIVEAVRVYVAFMLIYFGVTVCISNTRYQQYTDRLIAYASLGIGMTTLYALADHLYGLGWLSQAIKDDLLMQVGIHPGYTQMNNVNIGMLVFIVPYLFSRVLCGSRASPLLLLALVVGLLSAVLASRRMVLVLFVITPALVLGVGLLAGRLPRRCYLACATFYALAAIVVLGGGFLVGLGDLAFLEGFLGRLTSALGGSPDDPRVSQHQALLAGFKEHYVLGSGFGGLASVIRSEERPWTYELTYSRLLFNSGLIGVLLLGGLLAAYFLAALRKIRNSVHAELYIALLCGFLAILIAAASNPYLSSFDFVFAFSILPLILNSKDDDEGDSKQSRESSA